MALTIKVEGLKEFSRELKKLDSDLPKGLRLALNESAQLVVDGAQSGFPVRRGRARGSLKVASTRTLSRVRMGGARAPYAPWLDFGGSVGKRNSVKRPFIKEGRYVYPTYRKLRDSGKFEEVMSDALADLARRAGVEVD